MRSLVLQATANQTFTVTLDEVRYGITLRDTGTCVVVSVERDGEVILSGARVEPGTLLLPYPHLQTAGNFVFTTEDEELPTYTQFGVTQFLYYATAEEIEAERGT